MVEVWKPIYSPELYHYGVLGMKWGVHKAVSSVSKLNKIKAKYGLGDDFEPANEAGRNTLKTHKDLGKAYSSQMKAYRKLQIQSEDKLEKIEKSYQKKQAKADRTYQKAERKANSFLASKKSADRAFRKAAKAQYKANKVAYRGKRWYEEMQKAYKKTSIPMSKKYSKIGEKFSAKVASQSMMMYANSYRR